LGAGDKDDLEGEFFVDEATGDEICLVLGGHDGARGGSFFLLPGVRLEGLFLCLPCVVAFMVLFPVVVIDSHC